MVSIKHTLVKLMPSLHTHSPHMGGALGMLQCSHYLIEQLSFCHTQKSELEYVKCQHFIFSESRFSQDWRESGAACTKCVDKKFTRAQTCSEDLFNESDEDTPTITLLIYRQESRCFCCDVPHSDTVRQSIVGLWTAHSEASTLAFRSAPCCFFGTKSDRMCCVS